PMGNALVAIKGKRKGQEEFDTKAFKLPKVATPDLRTRPAILAAPEPTPSSQIRVRELSPKAHLGG
ncbi:MAG: hypothetical protein V1849_05865, partial [Chloroflexota bacterium]